MIATVNKEFFKKIPTGSPSKYNRLGLFLGPRPTLTLTLTLTHPAYKWATGPHFDAILICRQSRVCLLAAEMLICAVCSLSTWSSVVPSQLPVVQHFMWYASVIHSYHASKRTNSSFSRYVIHASLSSSISHLFTC